MEDIYVLGISQDYIPPAPSFSMDTFNFSLSLDKSIDSITKISCCANGSIDETFKSLNSNYSAVHVNIELRVDYMCVDSNMNFHKFDINKIIYVNLGQSINKRIFNIDTEILDLSVLNIKNKILDIYTVLLTCVY